MLCVDGVESVESVVLVAMTIVQEHTIDSKERWVVEHVLCEY